MPSSPALGLTRGKHDGSVPSVCRGVGVGADGEKVGHEVFAAIELRCKHERRFAVEVAQVDKVCQWREGGVRLEGDIRGRCVWKRRWVHAYIEEVIEQNTAVTQRGWGMSFQWGLKEARNSLDRDDDSSDGETSAAEASGKALQHQ